MFIIVSVKASQNIIYIEIGSANPLRSLNTDPNPNPHRCSHNAVMPRAQSQARSKHIHEFPFPAYQASTTRKCFVENRYAFRLLRHPCTSSEYNSQLRSHNHMLFTCILRMLYSIWMRDTRHVERMSYFVFPEMEFAITKLCSTFGRHSSTCTETPKSINSLHQVIQPAPNAGKAFLANLTHILTSSTQLSRTLITIHRNRYDDDADAAATFNPVSRHSALASAHIRN